MIRPGWFRLALLLPLLGQAPGSEGRQTAWQADIRIQAFDLTPLKGFISVRVVVASEGGAGALNAWLHLFLPVGSKAARLPPGCQPSPSPNPAAEARVDCELGEIRVREIREITIVTTTAPPGAGVRFAAFAYSDTPDPQMSNNYVERALP